MRFDILTLFPGMVQAVLGESIIGRAQASGLIELNYINIRDYANNRHNRVDDYPYGGGAGMVMQPMPVYRAFESIKNETDAKPYVIYMSPQGKCSTKRMRCAFLKKTISCCCAATMRAWTNGFWKKLWTRSFQPGTMC